MAFADSYDKTLRPVLNAVDEVARILGNDTRIPLPKTVVIGDQSSGKSSLLESVFGFPLPRGQDIVTRTPIQVQDELRSEEAALIALQGSCVSTKTEAYHKATQMLSSISKSFSDLAEGCVVPKELPSGAAERLKVSKLFHALCLDYKAKIEEACRPSYFLTDEFRADLEVAMQDYQGVSLANFLSHPVFVLLYKKFVYSELLDPSEHLVTATQAMVEAALNGLIDINISAVFPRLGNYSCEKAHELVQEQLQSVKQYVSIIVSSQESVMTMNHYYTDTLTKIRELCTQHKVAKALNQHSSAAMTQVEEQKAFVVAQHGGNVWDFIIKMSSCTDQTEVNYMEMQISLMAYSKVVMTLMYDTVPKVVRMVLIDQVCVKLNGALFSGNPDDYLMMMSDETLSRKLAQKLDHVEKLKKAQVVLKAVFA